MIAPVDLEGLSLDQVLDLAERQLGRKFPAQFRAALMKFAASGLEPGSAGIPAAVVELARRLIASLGTAEPGEQVRELLELAAIRDVAQMEASLVERGLSPHDIRRSLEPLFRLVPRRRRRKRDVLPLPDWVPFTADQVERGVHEALCRIPEWRNDVPIQDHAGLYAKFAQGFELKAGQVRMVVGYLAPQPQSIATLMQADATVLKLVHVLWARWLEQGCDPNRHAAMDFGQLCSDVGITPHKGGGYRREHKERVRDAYDALMGLELYAGYTDRWGERRALRGPVWERGMDTFLESPILGVSSTVQFRPGPFFSDPHWRPRNLYMGHISNALLQLDPNQKWALRLGLHYDMLARFWRDKAAFRDRQQITERVRDILQATGLDLAMEDEPAKQERRFEEAHDKLVAAGIIVSHGYGERPAADWRHRDKVVVMPADLSALPGALPGQLVIPLEP